VQAAFCGTAYGGVAAGHRVLGALAGTGIPIYDVEAGCASGGAALQLAAASIASGQYDRVLASGSRRCRKGHPVVVFARGRRRGLSRPGFLALRAQRLLFDTGLTVEHLAQVVVKNRRHGVDNPDAMFQKAVTTEEVLSSRMICPPLTLFMLCSPNEGAAAVVLTRDGDGVRLAGISLRSHLPAMSRRGLAPVWHRGRGHHAAESLAAADAMPRPASVRATSTSSNARTPMQDASCSRGELGLLRSGEQAAVLEGGDAELGGRRPVNPSGGLLSKGEPLGASASARWSSSSAN